MLLVQTGGACADPKSWEGKLILVLGAGCSSLRQTVPETGGWFREGVGATCPLLLSKTRRDCWKRRHDADRSGRGRAEEPEPDGSSRFPGTAFRPRKQQHPCPGEATVLPASKGNARLSSGSASTCLLRYCPAGITGEEEALSLASTAAHWLGQVGSQSRLS